MMFKILLFFMLLLKLASQDIVLTTDVNIKQSIEEDQIDTFTRGKYSCEQKLNFQLESYLKEELGIEIARSDLLRILKISKSVRFQAMRSKWVGERLFMIADYKFDQRELIKELDAYYAKSDTESSFDKQSLRYSVEKILLYKKRFEQRRLENTQVLLQLIKIGMHRRDLLDVFLYLAERKISFDIESVRRYNENSYYSIKNTFLQLVISKGAFLVEINNHTPHYLKN